MNAFLGLGFPAHAKLKSMWKAGQDQVAPCRFPCCRRRGDRGAAAQLFPRDKYRAATGDLPRWRTGPASRPEAARHRGLPDFGRRGPFSRRTDLHSQRVIPTPSEASIVRTTGEDAASHRA